MEASFTKGMETDSMILDIFKHLLVTIELVILLFIKLCTVIFQLSHEVLSFVPSSALLILYIKDRDHRN